jgi:hypothetical protein
MFRNHVSKIQVSLKSDQNKRYFIWIHVHLSYIFELFLEEEIFQTNVAQKIKNYILY